MDDQSFTRRKHKILELISQDQLLEACFLLRSIFQEIDPQKTEHNSWLLLNWLESCINLQDYEQASEVLNLSGQRTTSFNLEQNIHWLELRQKLIISVGISNVEQACQLLLIWRKLSPMFAAKKFWHQWERSNSETFKSLLEEQWIELFWEPLLWWKKWSKDFAMLSGPSTLDMLTAFELQPNTWLMELIHSNLNQIESEAAEEINNRLHSRIKNLNQKLNYYTPVIDLCEEINQAIKCKDQSKLNNLLGRGLPPNGYPNHKGAWWTCLEDNNDSTFVEYLLLNGAWVNIRNEHGFTALMLSVCMGNIKLFKLLNKYGADPLIRTFEGQTLLHLAVKNEHIKLISILLNMGLCPDMPDLKGITARHIANGSKVAEIIEIFKS